MSDCNLTQKLSTSPSRYSFQIAFSSAGVAMFSSFFAVGVLFSESGFSLWESILFTLLGFALPGQLVAAELFAGGASLVVIFLAVWLVNCRLLPMTIVLIPLLADTDKPSISPPKVRWSNFLLSHLIAVTSWVCYLATYRSLPFSQRRLYFTTIGVTLWLIGTVATGIGYWAGNSISHTWLIGLLFLNPIYFLCMMLRSFSNRRDVFSFLSGVVALPFVHQLTQEWDLVIVGILAGSICFLYFEYQEKI